MRSTASLVQAAPGRARAGFRRVRAVAKAASEPPPGPTFARRRPCMRSTARLVQAAPGRARAGFRRVRAVPPPSRMAAKAASEPARANLRPPQAIVHEVDSKAGPGRARPRQGRLQARPGCPPPLAAWPPRPPASPPGPRTRAKEGGPASTERPRARPDQSRRGRRASVSGSPGPRAEAREALPPVGLPQAAHGRPQALQRGREGCFKGRLGYPPSGQGSDV